MAKVRHIFDGILDYELDNAVDDKGFLTVHGELLLKKLDVIVEQGVIIEKSTIRNLIWSYNEWKKTLRERDALMIEMAKEYLVFPEGNASSKNKSNTLRHFIKFRIKIGEGTKIGKAVYIGLGATIGKYCNISDLAEVCTGSILHDRVYLGKGAMVGKDAEVETGAQLMHGAIVAPGALVRKNIIILQGCVFT